VAGLAVLSGDIHIINRGASVVRSRWLAEASGSVASSRFHLLISETLGNLFRDICAVALATQLFL